MKMINLLKNLLAPNYKQIMQKDPHIRHIIWKSAQLQIKILISSLITTFTYSDCDKKVLKAKIYKAFLQKSINLSSEQQKYIKIINSLFIYDLTNAFPELSVAERNGQARKKIKEFLSSVIDEELERVCLITEEKKETEQPQINFKRSLQDPYLQQKDITKLIKIEESDIQNLSDINTTKPVQSLSFHQFDPHKETQQFGDFQYGDIPQEILEISLVGGEIYVTVSWQQRSDGFLPETSVISADYFRRYYPKLLAQYYQAFIVSHKEGKQGW